MIYRGIVRGSVVALPRGVELPDGTEVTIEPVDRAAPPSPAADIEPTMRNGVPIFPRRAVAATPGLELVNQLREETP